MGHFKYHENNCVLQHTYPALETVIDHLHVVTLKKFKSDLEQSLRSREGFAASVRQCTRVAITEFDAGLRGI
jgi:hypothetical protein